MSSLEQAINYANENHDGNLTILKFTTNFRMCFGTFGYQEDYMNYRDQINLMCEGKTLEEAAKNLLIKPIDSFEVDKIIESNCTAVK